MKLKPYLPPFLITLVYWGLGWLVIIDLVVLKAGPAHSIIRQILTPIYVILFPAYFPGLLGGFGDAGNWVVNMIVAQLIGLVFLLAIITPLYFLVKRMFRKKENRVI